MVDSHAFHLTVDAIGSLGRDAIHEIGSHASPSTYRSRIALTFFKPSVIDNFNAVSINAPRRSSVSFFFFYITPGAHSALLSIAFYRDVFIG